MKEDEVEGKSVKEDESGGGGGRGRQGPLNNVFYHEGFPQSVTY